MHSISALLSPVLPRLQSPYDVSQRRPSYASPLLGPTAAMVNHHIAEHSGPGASAAIQSSPLFHASVPPAIRSPLLVCQQAPAIVQSTHRTSTTSVTALGMP